MVIPKFAVPDRFIAAILLGDLESRHTAADGNGLSKNIAKIGFTLSWTLEWGRDNPKDVVLAEAVNILMNRST